MPNPLTPDVVDGVLVAAESGRVVVGGVSHKVRRGRTTAHPDAAVVRARPSLWAPLTLDFTADPPTLTTDPTPIDGPARPADRASRGEWDAYAVELGADPDEVAGLRAKGDVIAMCDELTG